MDEADQQLREIMRAITPLDGAPVPFIKNGKIVLGRGRYFVRSGINIDQSILDVAPRRGTELIFDDPPDNVPA